MELHPATWVSLAIWDHRVLLLPDTSEQWHTTLSPAAQISTRFT